MKPVYLFSLVCLMLIGGVSCTHKSHDYNVHGDYLLIGDVGGFAMLPVYPFYLISNGELRKDTAVSSTNFPSDISGFRFNTLLPASKYETVKNLPSAIPAELLNHNNETIGLIFPDMGHTVVWASVNGVTYKWYFEGDQSNSSAAVQQFVTGLQVVFQ
jgi:hypothetical protein